MPGEDIAYLYDGSFDGLLCCVHESYYAHELPALIFSPETYAYTLYPTKSIETDPEKAGRVWRSVGAKISPMAQELALHGYYSCLEGKELVILKFLRLGYRVGAAACSMFGNETVHALQGGVLHLKNELQRMLQFLRFEERGGSLAAIVEPKNFLLPLMQPHFCSRYPEEHFLIYDATHGAALFYQPYEWKIAPVEHFELAPADERELRYQQLWQGFYDAISIESRYNPRCRMNHMPKRFWNRMVEFYPSALANREARASVGAAHGSLPQGDGQGGR